VEMGGYWRGGSESTFGAKFGLEERDLGLRTLSAVMSTEMNTQVP
jgi:hypothetical protein